jgi:LemA protein
MDYNEQKFKEHIKTIVTATDVDDDRALTLSELKELAISMGMSDNEWDALQEQAHQHLLTAEKHLIARNFVDAVKSADQATAINPYIKNGNSVLAQSYLMQWIDDNDSNKRDKAEFYARKEIKVDPSDKRAVNVLSTIQNKKRLEGSNNKVKKYVLIGVGILFFIGIVGYLLSASGSSESTKIKLIEAEENVAAKWGDIQAAMDRRTKLIPDLLSSLGGENDLNSEIKNLQEKINNSEGEERFDLEEKLDEKISEAKVKIKKEGNYKSNLIIEIEGAENRINFARKDYNAAVKNYNILVKTNGSDFPEFETKPYFE